MNLKCLRVPQNNDSFFAAVALTRLLPCTHDEDVFGNAFADLFGMMFGKCNRLLKEMGTLSVSHPPASLSALIIDYLRPRLAQFLLENSKDFETLFDSHEKLIQCADAIKNGRDIEHSLVATLLAKKLQVTIKVYPRIDLAETESVTYPAQSETTVCLLYINNFFQCLIDPTQLPTLQHQLVSVLLDLSDERIKNTIVDDYRQQLEKEQLGKLIKSTCQTTPDQLTSLATNDVPMRPDLDIIGPFMARPASANLALRSDPTVETRMIDMTLNDARVQLASNASIGGVGNVVKSLGKSAAVGGLGSLSVAGAMTLVGGLGATGLGLVAIPVVGIPLFVITFLSTLGAAAAGKHYALEYEKMLHKVRDLITKDNYTEASEMLDQEFNRWIAARAARRPFLTKQHYAVAHFFRGSCARQSSDYEKAYTEYETASVDAKDAGSWSLYLILQLQKIDLLQRPGKFPLPAHIKEKKDEINSILVELTPKFNDGFADLYWRAQDKMFILALRLAGNMQLPLSEAEIASVNGFLQVDSLSMLKHFAEGKGELLEVFGTFFQGVILTYFYYVNSTTYFLAETQAHLKTKLELNTTEEENLQTSYALLCASKKLIRCLELLKIFKVKYPKHTTRKEFLAMITTMETFASQFYQLFRKVSEALLEDSNKASSLLPTQGNVNAEIDFLTDLFDRFGIQYDSIENWLDALLTSTSPLLNRVSEKTGDTMLHQLMRLPARLSSLTSKIQKTATLLTTHRYSRNFKDETPLLTLQDSNAADPYKLMGRLYTESYVSTGDQLERVTKFIEKIKANPSDRAHLLLLEGPSGTGKTSIVENYLGSLGYPIKKWEQGNADDRYVGGLLNRIGTFFARTIASETQNTVQIMLVDEIDGVIPKTSGTAENGYHDRESEVKQFQMKLDELVNHRVVLIGTTNFPDRLPKAILDRASVNRVSFPLPTEEQRMKLLNNFLKGKKIAYKCIQKLAKVTVGYSPRQLEDFTTSISETKISEEAMKNYLNRYARTLQSDFREEFKVADLFMPSFEREQNSDDNFANNPQLKEQLRRLKDNVSGNPLHTLLYGPPGSGKTTAVRNFAQNAGRILIAVEADETTSQDAIKKIFSRAKQFGPVIIFFDEMDKIARTGTQHTSFIQTQMDGILANNITVIGATNYPGHFEPAIKSRFTSKIELPKLSAAELNKPIRKLLLESIKEHPNSVHFDSRLNDEMRDDAVNLAEESDGLDLRQVKAALSYFIGDLTREHSSLSPAGITYLRLQDVCFSILIKKVEERLLPRQNDGPQTSTEYIKLHRGSFFPAVIPEGSTPAPLHLVM